MDSRVEHALKELIARLEKKGFFEKYCHLVCPNRDDGICENCPYTRAQILEFWASEAGEEIAEEHE
ncbi:MAG: hypothetical protein ACI32N_08215 [Bulleidia sp.]